MQRRGGTTTTAATPSSTLKTNSRLAVNNNGDGSDSDSNKVSKWSQRRIKKGITRIGKQLSIGVQLLLVIVTLGTLLVLLFYTPHSRLSYIHNNNNYKVKMKQPQGVMRWDSYSVGSSSIINRAAAALNSQQQQQQQQQQHAKPSMDKQQQRRRRSKRKDSIIGNSRSTTTTTDDTTIIDTVGTVSPTTNTTLHIIFSTDCSTYQQWQSYLFFYSAYTVGQPGYITRIVSGCNDDDDDDSSSSKKKMKEDKERQWHNRHIRQVMSDRYRIHFTPKFSTVKEYNEDGGGGGGGGGSSSKGKEYKY